jgi:hypothetical protein
MRSRPCPVASRARVLLHLVLRALAQLLPESAFWFTRYLAVVPNPLPEAALAVHRRYLIVVPRPVFAAPRRYLLVVRRPLPAAPLVERRRYLRLVPSFFGTL